MSSVGERRDPADGVVETPPVALIQAAPVRSAGPRTVTVPVPRVTVGIDEAAAALGLSSDSFRRHVLPSLRVVRVGARQLVRIAELERWAQRVEMLE